MRCSNTGERDGDDGVALVMALMFIIMASMVIMPILDFSVAVNKSNRVMQSKISRAEAVKGGLRAALADPAGLYDACNSSGLTVSVALAGPQMEIPVSSSCTTIRSSTEQAAGALPIAYTGTDITATLPNGVVGASYLGGGAPEAWQSQATAVVTASKIFLPNLAAHALSTRSAAGYAMPAWVGSCRVYFPGTYPDPLTINTAVPVFFTSGVYYFKNTVTISGNAQVVVGGGGTEGCTNDQEAAYEGIGAPAQHNISGFGATFVFGEAGRLVVSDTGTTTGLSLDFNSRLVNPVDVAALPSAGVSIMTVNGVQTTSTTSGPFALAGQMAIPRSSVETNGALADPVGQSYLPSTLVPVVSPGPDPLPILDFQFATTNPVHVHVNDYVAVPQGIIKFTLGAGKGVGKDVSLIGGMMAARVNQTADLPAINQLGLINRIVQKTFKIVSTTTSGRPTVVSTALVTVNDYGEYVIGSWEVQ